MQYKIHWTNYSTTDAPQWLRTGRVGCDGCLTVLRTMKSDGRRAVINISAQLFFLFLRFKNVKG